VTGWRKKQIENLEQEATMSIWQKINRWAIRQVVKFYQRKHGR